MDTDERLKAAEQRLDDLEEFMSRVIRLAESYPMGRMLLKAMGLKKS